MPRIALIGAGHVNASLLASVRHWSERGWKVDFIAPGPFVYSGLATGVLSGEQPIDANVVDLAARARALGAACFTERLVYLNGDTRELRLESGAVRRFDVASLNLGSSVPMEKLGQPSEPSVFTSKPVSRLAALRQRVERDPSIARVMVLGGGVAGVEIACCLAGLRARLKRMIELQLVAPEGTLKEWPERGRRIARAALEDFGVQIMEGLRAKRVGDREVVLSDGRTVRADIIVTALGVSPDLAPLDSSLERGRRGGLAVDCYLQSRSMDGLFAGGDCVDTDPPLDRVGVYAVREARVIAQNITATLEGRPLKAYHPQRRYLQIMNLGDGSGHLRWGGFALRGRWALRLKNRLDQRFLSEIRRLPSRSRQAPDAEASL